MTLKKLLMKARPLAGTLPVLLLLAVALTACVDDDVPNIVDPADPPALLAQYVALGNSITAGFQSGGMHQEMQLEAYPVLLAEKAGADFTIPAIRYPGCPVPLAAPLSTELIADIPGNCAGRVLPAPSVINNLAVPGAAVADLSNPLYTGGGLATLLLGGQTQLSRLASMEPTLVSAWIGNNDALGAALSGDPSRLTELATFQSEFDEVVSTIEASGTQDAILIGVANAMFIAPALQPGAYFWAIGQPPSPFADLLQVSDNCAPVPGNPGASRLVSFLGVAAQLAANPAGPVFIDCGENAPFLLNAAEMQVIGTRVAQFNAYIEAQAAANGWIYINPTTDLFLPALGNPDLVRKCQGLATATTQQEFAVAVQTTCPGPSAPNFFGSYFSFDGVHPSAEAHETIANVLAQALNEKHGLSLPIN